LGITPLALELLDELRLLDDTTEELLEDLIEELLEERMLLLDEERTLDELSELAELDTPQLPTTPKGEGWEVQVAVEIQLLLFS
jgi:hypothetical protein